tara:strand:- start:95 stop:1423 length:1329 start_codon:yes stop_codon:yes gene_type:complete
MINATLPINTEAESAVLGSILKGGNDTYRTACEWIKNEHAFYYRFNDKIWKSFNILDKNKKKIDAVTVTKEVKKLLGDNSVTKDVGYYLTGLLDDIATISNIDEYCKMVWEEYIKREAIRSAQVLANTAASEINTIADVLHKHEHFSRQLRLLQPSTHKDVFDITKNTFEQIDSHNNLIPFGIEFMDKSQGGMTRQELTVIGGRPGHGKSTLMINIVRKLIKQEFKVMLFNREMSNTEMMKKLIVVESKDLNYERVRKHNINDKEKKQIEKTIKDINNRYNNLIMFDNIKTLPETIHEVNKHKPDIIIDDYIQLIDMNQYKSPQRRHEIETIMYEYKWLCKSMNASAILISQLNREIERRDDPVPQMSDFAESGAIEQTAEMAAFVYYPYNVDPEINDKYESKIVIAKARYGKIGRYRIGYNGERCKFYNNVELAKGQDNSW